MAIIARLTNGTEVEIVDVFRSTAGKRVLVKACQGEPFLNWSHGGWISTSWATVSLGEVMILDQAGELGPQEPPGDPRIFNKRQPDGSYRPISEFFDREVDHES